MNYETSLPEATDAERTILGALLLDKSRLLEVAATLTLADFSLDSHKRIFEAMLALGERDAAIDIVTLMDELGRRKEIEAVGGSAYLFSLTEGLPRRPVIDEYVRIVKDKSFLRQIAMVSTQITARAFDQSETGLELAAAAISALSVIADSGQTDSEVHTCAELAIAVEREVVDNPPDEPAVPTGIAPLDEMTGGGIRIGELWIVGAPPSRGKTTLARQMVASFIIRNLAAYVQSGEMTKENWFAVTACLLEGLPTYKLREPRLMNLTEREQLRVAIRKLAELPMAVSDRAGIHIDRLIYNAKREKQRNDIKVLAVDFAQIVKAKGRDKKDQVSEVADKLRQFAHDEKVATILLSQLARPDGRNLSARPNMFSLKESGDLEAFADTIALIFRPVDPQKDTFTGEDEIIIGKQRNGVIGNVQVYLNGKYLKFQERLVNV